MKIALVVSPSLKKTVVTQFPFGMASVVGVLNNIKVETSVFDCRSSEHLEELTQAVKEYDLVILSTAEYDKIQCYSLDLEPSKHIIDKLRAISSTPIAILGPHGTVNPTATNEYLKPNYILQGWYETSVLALMNVLNSKKVKLPKIINGNFSNLSRVINNCFPVYDICKDVDYYTEIPSKDGIKFVSASTILTSYYCSNSCIFCYKFMGMKGYLRSIEHVVIDIQKVFRQYKHIYFADPVFCATQNRMQQLCEALISLGRPITYTAQLSPDRSYLNEDNLQILADSGCMGLFIGAETLQTQLLQTYGKNVSLEYLEKMVDFAGKLEIGILLFWIIGFENESVKSLEELLEYLEYMDTPFFISELIPRPGTILFNRLYDGENFSWPEIAFSYENKQYLGISGLKREDCEWFWNEIKRNNKCLNFIHP